MTSFTFYHKQINWYRQRIISHNITGVLQRRVKRRVRYCKVFHALDELEEVEGHVQLVLERTWLEVDARSSQLVVVRRNARRVGQQMRVRCLRLVGHGGLQRAEELQELGHLAQFVV